MALYRPNVVDAIGTEIETGVIVLSVLNEIGWEEECVLEALKTKLSAYLAFIESGELIAEYPAAKDAKLRIEVISRTAISKKAIEFIRRAEQIFMECNCEIAWRTIP